MSLSLNLFVNFLGIIHYKNLVVFCHYISGVSGCLTRQKFFLSDRFCRVLHVGN